MWTTFWQWTIDNYVFHALVAVGVFFLVFSSRFGKRLRKFKAGPTGIELDTGAEEISPETPCPYRKSQESAYSEIHNVKNKVDHLENEVHEIMEMVKNLAIDQQKQLFYDANQPAAERLAGGLKYVFLGGNGHSKKDIEKFAEEHKDIYNALTHVKPELRLIYEGGKT